MDIEDQVRQPVTSAFVELFQFHAKKNSETEIFYLTPSTNGLGLIDWNENQYVPFPIKIDSVSRTSKESPARPTLTIANMMTGRLFGTLANLYGDLVGSKVVYIRTFADYLTLESNISLSPMTYFVNQMKARNKTLIQFELRVPMDSDRLYLPRRQMLLRDFPGLSVVKQTT